ncbi:hypothetical protein [Rhodopseudomonas sp.]
MSDYLQTASIRLKEIADARQAAAKARLIDLDHYRKILRADSTGGDLKTA